MVIGHITYYKGLWLICLLNTLPQGGSSCHLKLCVKFSPVFFLLILYSPAYSIGIGFTGPTVSISVSYNTKSKAWIIGFDPDGIQQIDLDLNYDTNLLLFNSDLTGFLCDFSQGGDCPTDNSQSDLSTVTHTEILPGEARLNTMAILDIDEIMGTVKLNYDLSNNPTETGFDRQFFQLALNALTPLSLIALLFMTHRAIMI